MVIEILKDKWASKVNTVTIGATKEQGGTRTSTVTVGGQNTLPYLFAEGNVPNRPVIAMEILDNAYCKVKSSKEIKLMIARFANRSNS